MSLEIAKSMASGLLGDINYSIQMLTSEKKERYTEEERVCQVRDKIMQELPKSARNVREMFLRAEAMEFVKLADTAITELSNALSAAEYPDMDNQVVHIVRALKDASTALEKIIQNA